MRLIAPGATPPAEVNKYLLPHEEQVITVRRHPAILIGPIAITLAGLVIAVVLSDTLLRHQSSVLMIVWILWGVLALFLIWKTALWAVDYFVVTSHRMLLAEGLITRKVAMMPLVKVTDMSFQRSFLGRIFGYGTFILESAGQDQALRTVDHIPYPEQLYLEVCGLIFVPKDSDDD
ncbi:MAG: PH domain-containing protein [Nocardiopsaceae bacterium]|jgi:membrane protein YdbS with pleckstrin-like domain|nr:PH domain-containing protein [Nocardiopsaceae bacterium]